MGARSTAALRRVASCLLPLALLGGCSDGEAPQVVRFLVVGDTGTGPDGFQYDVARVMEQVCAQRGCDFALVTGDNIYERGVTSVTDSQFETAFRTPYANLNIPFFVTLGNHDNTGNTAAGDGSNNGRGDFQVDYTYSPGNVGRKWNMPDRYFGFTWPQTATLPMADFVSIDASPITHYVNDTSRQWSGDTVATYIADQQTFIADRFRSSQARWKFAFAHHPYLSNGEHGNAGSFEQGTQPDVCTIPLLVSATCRGAEYKAFVEAAVCNEADVMFSGHDHELYWLQPTGACGKTEFIVSGAGSKTRVIQAPDRNPAYFQVGDIPGFFWVELNGDTFTGAAYTETNGISTRVDTGGRPLPVFERSFRRRE